MSEKISKVFKINARKQSLEELWISIAKLAQDRVEDNDKSDEYPLGLRMHQTATLRHLIDALDAAHIELMKGT